MKQMTINVNNDKYQMFKAFIESLDYAKIINEKDELRKVRKREVLNDIKEGIEEVLLIENGKSKGLSLKELLDGL